MPTPHHDPAKLDLRHGLTFDKTKNSWRLRVTISRGRKLVGCRVPIWPRGSSDCRRWYWHSYSHRYPHQSNLGY